MTLSKPPHDTDNFISKYPIYLADILLFTDINPGLSV
tara:strand:- start:1491 stop:1601 length:111 start_codon:yes stop_codon:yes gene_type:complete